MFGQLENFLKQIQKHLADFVYSSGWFRLFTSKVDRFDKKKDIKAVRMPLGFAAKVYVSESDEDRLKRKATSIDEGYYYKWYFGIHMLCGEEELRDYKHRPSHQERRKVIW